MSSYDWLEVKRLAADFQRAQLSTNLQRLTEGNCIEIISKLIKLRLLDVVFTNDGKTYITQQHLLKEIKDELYIHNGHVTMIDISKSLNVDVDVISSAVQDLMKMDTNLRIVLGQLIDRPYIIHIAEDINEKLQQHGCISVNDLTRIYDLPGDYIHSIIKEYIGKIITNTKQDKQEIHMYYTDCYFVKNRAIIRGSVLAITRPTLVTNIINQCNIEEHTFYSMIDSLIDLKQIPGVLTDRFSNTCTYIPHIYLKSQSELVINSFKQNGYLEYRSLSRAGISEPKTFITKALPGEDLMYLKTCLIGRGLLDRVEVAVEDSVLYSNLWIDIMTTLPLAFEVDDAELIILKLMKNTKLEPLCRIFAKTFIVSNSFINAIHSVLMEQIAIPNAKEMLSSGRYEHYMLQYKISQTDDKSVQEISRKDERKKRAAVGKSGGGTQGRETKTKSVKKKYGQKNFSKTDDSEGNDKKYTGNSVQLEVVKFEDVKDNIESHSSFCENGDTDCTEVIEELANYFHPLINKNALNTCQSLYLDHMANVNSSRRKTNAVLQDTMLSLYQDIKLYQKGIKQLTDNADLQQQLNKYLLKTTATQLTNTCFAFIGDSNDIVNSLEGRLQILSTLDDKCLKESCTKLHKSLNGNSVDEFLSHIEDTFSDTNIMIKKSDKKKEKTFLESHRKALMDKLVDTENPALVLHLVCLILFQDSTQTIVNASGRFVSTILTFLKDRISPNMYSLLQRYHGLVMKMLVRDENDITYPALMECLKDLTPAVKCAGVTQETLPVNK